MERKHTHKPRRRPAGPAATDTRPGVKSGRAPAVSYPQKYPQNKKGSLQVTPMNMTAILTIPRYIISISSVIMLIVIAYFMRGLSWNTEKDRASIVGFTWMMITIVGSAILMWI